VQAGEGIIGSRLRDGASGCAGGLFLRRLWRFLDLRGGGDELAASETELFLDRNQVLDFLQAILAQVGLRPLGSAIHV
jgi:hypothetical protein